LAPSEDDSLSGSSSLIPVLLPVLGVVFVIAIPLALFLWRRRRPSDRRHRFSDSDDESARSIEFCTDSGLTVNDPLTMTLTDANDVAWPGSSEHFNTAGFGLQL
jgi:hypothetical protein